LLIRYQFRNHLTIIEINLKIKFFVVSKIVSNLVIIATNYFLFLKIDFYFMIFFSDNNNAKSNKINLYHSILIF